MWILLVTTVASAVLADTGYVYNAPNVPFNLPRNQPTNSYPLYNVQRYLYNNEDERSNEYLKKKYLQNNDGLGNPSYITGHSNNEYMGFNQPFTPLIPLNNNYAHANFQHAASPLAAGGNIGYMQAPTNGDINFNNAASYSNSNTLPSIGLNQNIGYAQSLRASGSNNYNNGYLQSYASHAPIAQKNIYNQPLLGLGNFVNTATTAGAYNNGITQTLKPVASISSSNEYNQVTQTGGSSNNAYSENTASSVGIDINSGYDHSINPLPSSLNNGYTVTVLSSTSNSLHPGYGSTGQPIAPPVGFTVSNGYEQSFTSSSSANFKTGYEQTSTSRGVNDGFVRSQTPNISANSNNGFSQPPMGPTYINLNSDITVRSTSSNLNNGSVLKGLERVVNKEPTNSRSSSTITPIIHKHIYFHVPPPEIEETGKTTPPLLPKKNYKILFIKMPSQESKSNLVRLQEQMRNAAIEDKTLIYLLVKKPEEPKSVVLPKVKPSDHQVFFVKYNGSPFDIAARVNEELDKTGSINSIVPLEPGLANGQHQ
ncbi:unnamed protein product [Arctia plantaginis]|uniref:DUF243 domain-containing protein n=1 Tax=Arctia plantaginis TaxID=874455 RepID=A0A8S0Z1P1_ARCPL|nr:unnamed protein product [Arctia plantaginis]